MPLYDILYRFGIALVIGFLVGLQRSYAHDQALDAGRDEPEPFAGVRTFSLLGLLGCGAAFLADVLASPWILVAVLVTTGGMIAVAYAMTARLGQLGMTSEIAALLTLIVGILCYEGYIELAAALGVTTTVLLALKLQTETLVERLTREDIYATLSFAVITAIILPLLPRTGYGPPPFDVLVPYKIWLMVVFISGISFLGYVLIKVVGTRRGIGLTGILGGLTSSTAVTLTFTQHSREAPGLARPFALAILLAWAVMFARVLVEVAVINPALLATVWLPITAGGMGCLGYCGYLYYVQQPENTTQEDTFKNPFQLGPAITFGLLYAVILLVANVAQMYFGDAGVYLSSIVSGVADVDAITLSMAELSANGSLSSDTATRAIVLAAASNTVVKGGIVLSTGAATLRRAILPGLILVLVLSLGVAWFV